jgi:hypothetical protein
MLRLAAPDELKAAGCDCIVWCSNPLGKLIRPFPPFALRQGVTFSSAAWNLSWQTDFRVRTFAAASYKEESEF